MIFKQFEHPTLSKVVFSTRTAGKFVYKQSASDQKKMICSTTMYVDFCFKMEGDIVCHKIKLIDKSYERIFDNI